MKTLIFAAAGAALAFASPAPAQTAQEQLDTRYDRALAAGYKALMLCGGIANAERVGEDRTPESVVEWELAGIQAPLDAIIGGLPQQIVRNANGVIDHVEVQWSDDMPPRVARYRGEAGCAVMPIGQEPPKVAGHDYPPYRDALARNWHERATTPIRANLQAALAGDYGAGTRTTAVIVDQRGEIVDGLFTHGFGPFMPQRTWSVAKSIAATLVGMAVHRGEADVNASAGLGADASDPRRAITVDHLLRMASGRYSDTPGNRTDPLYFGGATVDEVALDWPLIAAPGSTYRYANNDTLAAIAAIKPTFEAHPPADFFARLAMHDTVAETDWQGNYILSSQVWSTAHDLARLGQLYLNDGKLRDGTRVLPEGWVKYVSTPAGPQPDGPFGYGAGFWLLNKSDGVPPDTFAAFGNRGQYVVIVPSRNVVIVRRGEDPVGARFDIAAFTRDVLAALE
ncbi:MAG: serine hydrolase [Sphingomonadales bacterium BRH_c3]|nr:MAG: serine hydrolase [Sphingomonadales bacterium BRH_c3]